MSDLLSSVIAEYSLAENKFYYIKNVVEDFENSLDDSTEISLRLVSFGNSLTLDVRCIGFQNPDILYFEGYINGQYSKIIQHMSQMNFLLTSIPKQIPDAPARKIGFVTSN